jgi:hypothetical protein
MNSRRRIVAPDARANHRTEVHQGERIKSPLSNWQPMSALGQKRTLIGSFGVFALCHKLPSDLPNSDDFLRY